MDWWALMHKAMAELPWGSPENVKRMTLVQLACLASERAPGAKAMCVTGEDYLRESARVEAEEASWGG